MNRRKWLQGLFATAAGGVLSGRAAVAAAPSKEVEALQQKVFRFAIYHPAGDDFRLSLPLETLEDRTHGTLTISQG